MLDEKKIKLIIENLNRKPIPVTQAKKMIKNLKTLPREVIALLFVANGCIEEPTVVMLQNAVTKRTRAQAKETFRKFKVYCAEGGIDIFDEATYQYEGKKTKRNAKDTKKNIHNTIKNISSLLEMFNISPEHIEKKLQEISTDDGISNDEFIKDSLEVYHLLMAKAKGQIVTKKQTTKKMAKRNEETGRFEGWEVIGDVVIDETVSHLPDGKVWAEALVIKEVIENLENNKAVFITEEEENKATVAMIMRKKAEREKYEGSVKPDDDVIEAELEELTDTIDEDTAVDLDALDNELEELK